MFWTTFWEKNNFLGILTQGTAPSVIHGWKATDLLFLMVKRRNDFLNPISPKNFAEAFAETNNLDLEVRRMTRLITFTE